MALVTAEFLDADQYSRASIQAYEAVFGRDFLSPGGRRTAACLVAQLGLVPGSTVLDVGCGLGGSAFLMAREHGLQVDGIDLSRNMIALARERLAGYGLASAVRLEHGDCLALQRPGRYDAVYSRDVFLHIHDKAGLLKTLAASLRPGGVLLFTDYCCAPGPWSAAFTDYVRGRGYHLLTVDAYASAVAAAGFVDVAAEDRTDTFVAILTRELEAMPTADLPAPALAVMQTSWRTKLARARAGEQRWALVRARLPVQESPVSSATPSSTRGRAGAT